MFRSQVQILSPQRITPDSLAIGSFLFPKTRTPADLSPSAVLPSPSDRRSAFFRHLPAPFLSATCLHLPPTFLLLVLPFCRLLGGFLYISCLSVSPAFCNLRRGSSEPCRGGASGRLMGGGSLLPLPGCLRWIFRPLETPLETSSRNFIEPS